MLNRVQASGAEKASASPDREGAGWGSEFSATFRLAYPLIFTFLAQALIPATNLVLLGSAGSKSLAAGALGVNLYNGCMIFGSGLIAAAAPMMARSLGQRRKVVREVRRSVRQAMWAAVVMVVPIWAILWHTDALLVLLGQDPALSTAAASMVRPMMFGLLPLFIYQVLRAFVTVLDRPGWSFVIGMLAVVLNAFINYALILGHFGVPALGLPGAGIGSTIANCVLGGGMAIVVNRHRRFRRFHLFGNFWRADLPRLVHIFRLGLPIGVTLALESTCFNVAVMFMGLLGEAELAAHAIAIEVTSLCFQIPTALGQAATVRVARGHGRGDNVAIARAGWAAFAITIVCMTCMSATMLLAPSWLVGLFMSQDQAHGRVGDLATSFLTIGALFQLADGAQVVGAGMLRGLHDTVMPMIIAVLSYWVVGIGTAWLFAFRLGWRGEGVWVGLAAGLGTAAVLLMGRWTLRTRLKLI